MLKILFSIYFCWFSIFQTKFDLANFDLWNEYEKFSIFFLGMNRIDSNRFESKTHKNPKRFNHVQFSTQTWETVYSSLIQRFFNKRWIELYCAKAIQLSSLLFGCSCCCCCCYSLVYRYLLKLSLWCRLLRVR